MYYQTNQQKKTFHSKEEILLHYSEEQIMEICLGRSPSASLFCNPFRDDRNPSCNLKYYNGKLLFKDWATGFSTDYVGVAGMKLGIIDANNATFEGVRANFSEIINRLCSELLIGVIPSNPTQTKRVVAEEYIDIRVVLRDWQSYDLSYWCMSPNELKALFIFPLRYALLNGKPVMHSSPDNPTYGYFFNEYSTEHKQYWKIYCPFAKKHNKQKWISNIKSFMINKTW